MLDECFEDAYDLCRLRPFRVILIRRCVKNGAVAIENVGRRNRQLPAVVAIGERQVDERAAVDGFLRAAARDRSDRTAARLGCLHRTAAEIAACADHA